MSEVSNFDVFKEMANRGILSFKVAPPNNFKRAQTGKLGYGEVTMAVDNVTIEDMLGVHPPQMCLLIWDPKTFKEVEKALGEQS